MRLINKLKDKLINYLPESNRFERIWKLAHVDFKKRYYNDKLGIVWALINPISQIAIYYFVFTIVLERNEDNFVLFLFSGILIWSSFAEGSIAGSNLLVNKKYLIENIQFNWVDLYLSHMLAIFLGLTYNMMAYFIIMIILGVSVGTYFYLLPLVLLSWFLITISVSLLLSLIIPIFEDIKHIWSILILIGFWTSGIFFSGNFYIEKYDWFTLCNPFVGIILNFRAVLLEGNEFYHSLLYINIIYGLSFFILSIILFKKFSRNVIEYI